MKSALCVPMFAFAVMLASSAAYADPQAGAPAAPGAAPATASSVTPNGDTGAPPRRHGPCRDDVQKFCGNVPKGNGRILACLKAHVGQLSPRCEAAMKRHADQQAAPAATPSPSTGGNAPGK